jgi:hypothetical protein
VDPRHDNDPKAHPNLRYRIEELRKMVEAGGGGGGGGGLQFVTDGSVLFASLISTSVTWTSDGSVWTRTVDGGDAGPDPYNLTFDSDTDLSEASFMLTAPPGLYAFKFVITPNPDAVEQSIYYGLLHNGVRIKPEQPLYEFVDAVPESASLRIQIQESASAVDPGFTQTVACMAAPLILQGE